MKRLNLFSLLITFQFIGAEAHAFRGHDQFKIEQVKPWGEFGFRALGKGMHISEMRLDCSKSSEMGLMVSVVDKYGKTTHSILPAGQLGSDKHKCQANLKKYFANLYSKRGLASYKDKSQIRTLELNFVRGGLLTDSQNKKTLSFR